MTKKLKILACPANEGGCAYYRIILPAQKLIELHSDEVEVRIDMNPLGWDREKSLKAQTPVVADDYTGENLDWADVVWTQNIHNFGGPYTAKLMRTAAEKGKLTHYDNDDLLTDLYEGHRMFDAYKENGLDNIAKHIYSFVDIVSVTQRKFAERISPYVGRALVIIKNAIDYNLPAWNEPKLQAPRKGKVCRVGWVGGIHHEEDVKEFPGVALAVNARVGPENVHWGFYGRPPMPMKDGKPDPDWQQDVWDNYQKHLTRGIRHKNFQVYQALPAHMYGKMYSNIDIAIAPLQFNAFNDSKSEIKVAECGRYGIPLIATDCGCYDETIINGETGYLIGKDNSKQEWVSRLSKVIKDKKHREEMGRNLREITNKYFDINKNVKGRIDLYKEIQKAKETAHERASGNAAAEKKD